EPDLDHAGIGRMARKGEEGRSSGDFEEARAEILGDIEDFLEQRGQFLVGNELTGDTDALVVANEVRLDRGMDRQSFRLENRAQVSASRALAVGPGDV